jgi:hypothetical protein
MRKLLIFFMLPTLIVSYFAYGVYERRQNEQTVQALAKGIEKFKRAESGWPQDFSNIEPYLENADAVRSLNPTFLPISEREAYMEHNTWSSMAAKRVSSRVVLGADGTCTLLPTRRL